MDYEKEVMRKIILVLEAASANTTTIAGQDIEIKTSGFSPSASVKVPAYVLRKYLKDIKG